MTPRVLCIDAMSSVFWVAALFVCLLANISDAMRGPTSFEALQPIGSNDPARQQALKQAMEYVRSAPPSNQKSASDIDLPTDQLPGKAPGERKRDNIEDVDGDGIADDYKGDADAHERPRPDDELWRKSSLTMPVFMWDTEPMDVEPLADVGYTPPQEPRADDPSSTFSVPNYAHSPKVVRHAPAAGQPPIFPFINVAASVDHKAVRTPLPPPAFKLGSLPPLNKHHKFNMDVPFEEPPLDDTFLNRTSGVGYLSLEGLDFVGCVHLLNTFAFRTDNYAHCCC